jgi:N-succinyldiaminopimelate aminotransferase
LNPRLARLQTYPFERLGTLLAGATPNPALRPINLSIGEPKHPTPALVKDALSAALDGLAIYPRTAGLPELRAAIANWARRRYALAALDPETQVLPVNGSREALFSFAQAIIDAGKPAKVLCPNPFYQIYEGAALLAGATPVFLNDGRGYDTVDWRGVQLAFACSPGNPTGRVNCSNCPTATASSSPRTSAIRKSTATRRSRRWAHWPPRSSSAARTSVAWWSSPACPSARTRPACAPGSSPATRP